MKLRENKSEGDICIESGFKVYVLQIVKCFKNLKRFSGFILYEDLDELVVFIVKIQSDKELCSFDLGFFSFYFIIGIIIVGIVLFVLYLDEFVYIVFDFGLLIFKNIYDIGLGNFRG